MKKLPFRYRRDIPLPFTLAGAVFYLLLVLTPLFLILGSMAAEPIPSGLFGARIWLLLGKTILYCTAVSLLAGMFGLFFALACDGAATRCRNAAAGMLLRWCFILLLPIPPYIHALAWSGIFPSVSGWTGAVWCGVMAQIPLCAAGAMLGINAVPRFISESGALYGTPGKSFFKVIWPLLRPYWMISMLISLIINLGDYTLPSLFGKNVYALEIYTSFASGGKAMEAYWLSIPLFLIIAFIMFWVFRLGRTLSFRFTGGVMGGIKEGGKGFKGIRVAAPLRITGVTAAILTAVIPLISMLAQITSLKTAAAELQGSVSELLYSFFTAILTAALCVLPALFILRFMQAFRKTGRIFGIVNAYPVSFAASVIAIAWIGITDFPILKFLYGSHFLPAFASATRFFPVFLMCLLAAARHVDKDMSDAAGLYAKNSFSAFFKRLYMLRSGIIGGMMAVGVLTLAELGAAIFTVPPGLSTLTIKIYNYLHYGQGEAVAALCLLMTVSVWILAGLGGFILRKRRDIL